MGHATKAERIGDLVCGHSQAEILGESSYADATRLSIVDIARFLHARSPSLALRFTPRLLPSRRTLRTLAEYARENLNVAAQYAGDYATPGDVGSVDDIVVGEGAIVRHDIRSSSQDCGEAMPAEHGVDYRGSRGRFLAWPAASAVGVCAGTPAPGSSVVVGLGDAAGTSRHMLHIACSA